MKRALTILLIVSSLLFPHTSQADDTTIHLKPGFNMISMHAPADIGQWLQEIGFGNEIDRAIAWDAQAQQLVVLTPDDSPPASFAMAGDEGIIVHAAAEKEVSVRTATCSDFQFRQGVNLVALACQGPDFSAFDLLAILGSDRASSIQRYNTASGAFETAAFDTEGAFSGVDFAIAPGEGYFLFMRQAVSALDMDADGILDADESNYGTAVDDPDSDDDGLLDGLEVHVYGTNPLLEDTDEDTFTDAVEVAWGTNPLDFSDTPPVHDPQEVITPLDPTVATTLFDASLFLYTGASPIQTGMDPAVIDPQRAAVLRGQVHDRAGRPLPGVSVTILHRPEYGQTLTRHDGWFDLAVNGGGPMTIDYAKDGYLAVQRKLEIPLQDYVTAPDAVMVQLDPMATSVDLTSPEPISVARGSLVSDSAGSRQATLMFQQGTDAEIIMPDGSGQQVTSLTVRATEYTLGDNGPQAMPAELPPASGYTYCVELTADEALAAGAVDVTFSKPLYFYVENFIGFPTGTPVPVGFYDRQQGIWIPSKNGRVIQITGTAGGLADVDIDGDGTGETTAELEAFGMGEDERQRLAALYALSQTLWRIPITHFTPWDPNFPFEPPEDAEEPRNRKPKSGDEKCDGPCEGSGSIIQIQNQVLGQSIPITGTPYTLEYHSDRARGRSAASTLDIQISGDSVPASLQRIDVIISVAGMMTKETFPALPNQSYTFIWNGRDIYNRPLQGQQPIEIRIGYVYPAVYQQPVATEQSFGLASGVPIPGVNARQEAVIWQEWKGLIGAWDAGTLGLGGWGIDVVHAYNPQGRVLNDGMGATRNADTIGLAIDWVEDPRLLFPSKYTGPDGARYFPFEEDHIVVKVDTEGNIAIVAGNGTAGFSGDGGLAVAAQLDSPYDLIVGEDGSIYIGDFGNHRIRKVDPDGIITTIAGTGSPGNSGDGGPALAAQISGPIHLSMGSDGSIYFPDPLSHSVRRVGTDGIILTLAGTGSAGYGGDGGPAASASLSFPVSTDVDESGRVFIADSGNHRIRRIGIDGTISTVAGTGVAGFAGDGGPAVMAQLDEPVSVAVGPEGSFVIADKNNNRIRTVGTDGVINTLAGNGEPVSDGNKGPAAAAGINAPVDVFVGPDGGIFVFDIDEEVLRRIGPQLPGFSLDEIVLPSEDGSEIYVFSPGGRHLRTLNALTAGTLLEFDYNDEGQLLAIRDAYGNETAIDRDNNGVPTGIEGPYGQQTTFSVNADGFVERITNPAGESDTFEYTFDGLMTSHTDANEHRTDYGYNGTGQLTRVDDPAGGFQTFVRSAITDGYRVTHSTALDRTTVYDVQRLATGEQRLVSYFPDGNQVEAVTHTDGSQTLTYADGTTVTQEYGPDPRYGMQAPVTTRTTIAAPSGLTATIQKARTATLANPDDPLSAMTLAETIDINGQVHQFSFDSDTGTMTITSPEGRVTTTTLDASGRLANEQMTGLAPVSIGYDTHGRITAVAHGAGAEARTFSYIYDTIPSDDGFLDRLTDPESSTVLFSQYDAAGRLQTATLPNARQVQFAYDGQGNLMSVAPPGRPAHTFDRTQVDLIQAYIAPDAGTGSSTTSYEYNPDRQLELETRADGRVRDYVYDAATGRLTSIAVRDGATPIGAVVNAYYPAGHASPFKLASITAVDGGTVQFSYDGALLTGIDWSGEASGSVGYGYNQNFEVASETVNGAWSVDFLYDQDGLLRQAGQLVLNRDVPTEPDTMNGLLRSTTLSNAGTSLAYNQFGEVQDFEASFNGLSGPEILFESHVTLSDSLGRVLEKTETTTGETTAYAYTYDQAGRLWLVTENGVPVREYEYDANGNRLLYDGEGALDVVYDNQDRLLQYGDTTYTYRASGELSTKTDAEGQTRYDYDVFGNLIEVELPDGTLISYLVDGADRRIGKRVNGTLVQAFLYGSEVNPVAELDASENVVSRFVYGGHGNVPQYMIKDSRTYRLVSDYLGSVRLVMDATDGTIAQRLNYDEFGNVLLDSNPGFQPFGFAGGLYDPDTDLVRFGARDYDPHTGRWTRKDPLMFNGDGTNLYVYAKGDPINNIDMLGTITTCARCPNPEVQKSPNPKPRGKKKFKKKGKKWKKKKGRKKKKKGKKKRKRRPPACPVHLELVPIPPPQPVSITVTDDATGASFPVEVMPDYYGGLVAPGTPLHDVDIVISEQPGMDPTVTVTMGDVVGYTE